jgi:hypothetical protein
VASSGRVRHAMGVRLFEGASALVMAGIVATIPMLERDGDAALRELAARGYSVPTSESPVSVVPFEGGSASHAAGWRPGVVSIRPEPTGGVAPSVYLRHELVHEASYRTCKGSLPAWAEEAAAIAFSGEVYGSLEVMPSEDEIEAVRKATRLRAPLMPHHLRTIARLVGHYGWPIAACAVSPEIEKVLAHNARISDQFSFVLMSYSSGRVLAEAGDQKSLTPVGSLLKIPFVASLQEPKTEAELGALLASDTATLERSVDRVDLTRYRHFVQGVGGTWRDGLGGRALLGERDARGEFPFEFSLVTSARLIRSALLHSPAAFSILRSQGSDARSTLHNAPPRFVALLRELSAGAKTGSVSDSKGEPLVGHLAVFWPADAPTLIAVFRKSGVRGASLAELALPVLERWRGEFRSGEIDVRVALLSQLPRSAWALSVFDGVPGCRETRLSLGGRATSCGVWAVTTGAPRARRSRLLAGVVSADERTLTTDRETYADAVVASEGDGLPRAARQALRAVVLWNALHGGHVRGHSEEQLCDTTHCMVFLGHSPDQRGVFDRAPEKLAPASLAVLRNAPANYRSWFPFSLGGGSPWERRVSDEQLTRVAREPLVLDVRRERRRTGEVFLRFVYEAGEECVPCDKAMTLLDLPSCPDAVRHGDARHYVFSGVGRGHDMGLSLERARRLALEGKSAEGILRDALDSEGARENERSR